VDYGAGHRIGRCELIWLLLILGCKDDPDRVKPVDREPCAEYNRSRNLYFGDLHVHTRNSFDAWIYDIRLDPEDAYRFARGEEVGLPPLDAEGEGTRRVQLERPLDFAAVTDHAEYLAEVAACTTAGSEVYDTTLCVDYRAATVSSIQVWGSKFVGEVPFRFPEICDVIDCPSRAGDVWTDIQDAAEAAYDRKSTCEFTSFVAYEWSATPNVSNMHRNVIFRNAEVPELPISTFEEARPEGLWEALAEACTGDCDVLAIPHNSNQSNGNIFHVEHTAESAEVRIAMEPLIEIYQHKGDSECRNGIGEGLGAPDEHCDFEKLRAEPVEDCGDSPGAFGMANGGCGHRRDFIRGILVAGFEEQRRIGVNPYTFGITASTDTHNGTPGLVEEFAFQGHLGLVDGTPEDRLTYPELTPAGIRNSPGGLTAVWAPENSRDAIFDALRRKEVYGTSGPRISLRFFGGDLPADLCEQPDLNGVGYRDGVPMGGTLTAASAPTFAIQALRDVGTEGHPGTALQKLQIVKGWVDASGSHYEVIDVAATEESPVDLGTCEVGGGGVDEFCEVWTDPNWAADQDAWYYVRVLEQPSCRWSWFDCLTQPEGQRADVCTDPTIEQTVVERAWSSPIWVTDG